MYQSHVEVPMSLDQGLGQGQTNMNLIFDIMNQI